MKKTKFFLFTLGVTFVLAAVVFLENPASVEAAESCFPVKIWDREKIEPLSLSVNTGDCVVWVNLASSASGPGITYHTPASEVLVLFPKVEGCNLEEITTPTGFKMDLATQCFVGGWLRPGATASLLFKKPGTYRFDIQFRIGKELGGKTEGKVIVK